MTDRPKLDVEALERKCTLDTSLTKKQGLAYLATDVHGEYLDELAVAAPELLRRAREWDELLKLVRWLAGFAGTTADAAVFHELSLWDSDDVCAEAADGVRRARALLARIEEGTP